MLLLLQYLIFISDLDRVIAVNYHSVVVVGM
ncbi:hypothetical protein EMUR_03045 [Ehrlichia muris AS145]|uniref:Uncharacterized protein n=1 Tax=Ehrlichia muris AS145 TaxID=1423892 RepID=V9R7D2_9RICK|nr:hypothetical protein EMUR_03035 [Ehrlichia muris AS145]AHC39727.1 hypothetical protein EMUR_03040 [Ehrlichia muris AS145]AHC39728.1 hypothetical protein EMUR_03045 [Ehrlichia muris AS145]